MGDYLKQRGGWYYFHRRVPAHLKRFDPRSHIRIALKTRSEAEAKRRAISQNDFLEAYWRDLISRKKVHGQDETWHDAVTLARAHGFQYMPAKDIAEGSVDQILGRLSAAKKLGMDKRAVRSLLGTVERPSISLLASLEAYFDACGDKLAGKSADFIRKWKNPRKRAVENFEKAVGFRTIETTTRRDILDFRKWWLDRVAGEAMNAGTALKDFVHLKHFLKVLAREAEIEIEIPTLFSDISLKAKTSSRAPFRADFVQDHILAPGKLDGLNEQARAIVLIMADSGCRVNEVCGLLPADIVLDAPVPFLWIRPNAKRTLKTAASTRQIPLVGASLLGVSLVPQGFTRYEIADSAGNLIRQYMEEKGLFPSADHTLYSLRHTFKDRLRDIGAPDEIIDELMGHSSDKPRYGRGHLLEKKLEWMQKIAFTIAA